MSLKVSRRWFCAVGAVHILVSCLTFGAKAELRCQDVYERPSPVAAFKRFDPSINDAFRARLQNFRQSEDVSMNPQLSGSEGQLFLSLADPTRALKRFFKDSGLDWQRGNQLLREADVRVAAAENLRSVLAVVQIYEAEGDWILRDFDSSSVPLEKALQNPRAASARFEAMIFLKSQTDPVLQKILKKLQKKPISPNLQWSPRLQKILVIDMQ